MTFMRKFDTLLHKSNGNLCKIDSQDGITIYNYDNNFNLLSSKKLMDGDLSFLDFWFDIDANDNIYGLINDKMGTLLSYKISNKYIFKSKFLEYYPNEESIKFVYINSNSGSTNLFYYKLNVNNEIRSHMPEALWDKISEDLVREQCLSLWTCCIECIKEMADAWEEQNGENLVWVPGHYEKKG